MDGLCKIRESMKIKYAVFRLDSKMVVEGMDATLPKGQYIIPVFDKYEDAKEAAGDRFEIVEGCLA